MAKSFYRVESPTQKSEDAILQVQSGEIWGATPRGGNWPTVQAYPGSLEPGDRGINFQTEIDPYPNGSPLEARWYYPLTAGVELRNRGDIEYACVTASVQNKQP